jgi:large subunit ribosomal protein L29
MNSSELRNKTVSELEKEIVELSKAGFALRMMKASHQLSDHSQLKKGRASLARAKTILLQKKKGA